MRDLASIFWKIMRDQAYSEKLWEIKPILQKYERSSKHILQNYERSSIFCKIMRDQAYSAKKLKVPTVNIKIIHLG